MRNLAGGDAQAGVAAKIIYQSVGIHGLGSERLDTESLADSG